jgi:hypothetical protein
MSLTKENINLGKEIYPEEASIYNLPRNRRKIFTKIVNSMNIYLKKSM